MSRDRAAAGEGATRSWIFAALIVALVLAALWPGVHGFWGRDDYAVLAIVRMIGSPLHFFSTDHFPVAHSVFRPLGFASMWLCVKMFGNAYAPNAAFDLALHASVSLMLFRLVMVGGGSRTLAMIGALFFALHPATSGTALWWSARFDLLATLFVLIAVDAAIRYTDSRRTAWLAAALLAALAAALSKEIGLVACVALIAVWLRDWFVAPADRRRPLTAIALTMLVGALFLMWRWCVLGTPSSAITGPVPMIEAFVRGVVNVALQTPGYWAYVARLPMTSFASIALCVFAVIAILILARKLPAPVSEAFRQRRVVLWCGLVMVVTPIVLQAPIAAFGSALSHDMSAVEAAMQSRLYYLQIAGLVLVTASFIAPSFSGIAPRARQIVVLGMSVIVILVGSFAHRNARAFAHRSSEIAVVARAAAAAVDKLSLPESNCHVAFQDYAPAPEWSQFVSMDSIVKALSTDVQRVGRCWFHSNLATFFFIESGLADATAVAPFVVEEQFAKPLPWRRVGDFTYAYLDVPVGLTASDVASIPFLQFDGSRVIDVSDDVHAGRIPFELK